jgi:hypothetical protein
VVRWRRGTCVVRGYAHNTECARYHACSSKTTVHRIFHNAKRPSHLPPAIIADGDIDHALSPSP